MGPYRTVRRHGSAPLLSVLDSGRLRRPSSDRNAADTTPDPRGAKMPLSASFISPAGSHLNWQNLPTALSATYCSSRSPQAATQFSRRPDARCCNFLRCAGRQSRRTAKGQALPLPAVVAHVRSTSVSCRNRCGAANGEFVPKAVEVSEGRHILVYTACADGIIPRDRHRMRSSIHWLRLRRAGRLAIMPRPRASDGCLMKSRIGRSKASTSW
jgi:hypothetical protein